MKTSLQEAAMLATLNISQWTARKYDKKVSKEVEAAHSAKDAGRFNKILVAKESLEEITKIAGAARAAHYKMTLAWDDNGPRLLPATMFMQYTDAIKEHKRTFESAVNRFIRNYPTLREDARNRLGSMYEPMDYPPVDDIQHRFGMELAIDAIARADDFRVQLNDKYVSGIRAEIESRVADRQAQAVKECWERMREVVSHMHTRLSDEKAIFRDSLINNARELVSILPALNFMNDPALEATRAEVETMLVDPTRLREDVTLRSETARKAAEILAKLPKLA